MVEDLGNSIKPYLKSWYAAGALDPKVTHLDGMTSLGDIQAADIDAALASGEGKAMNLSNWIDQAKVHWQENQPALVADLQAKGRLSLALREAANRTHAEMSALEASGMTTEEAWQMTRNRYLFPAPASPTYEEPVSEAARLFGEAMQVMQADPEA